MDRHEYLLDENWYGSFYEISLELGPVGNDALAMQALRALWSQPEVRGPWRERSDFDSEPDDAAIEIGEGHLYGCFILDDGSEVGCMSYLVRADGKSDWLDLAIPVGMLERRFSISYPLDMATNPWMVEFDERLARIGAAIYDVAPFRLGLIGEETSGVRFASDLTVQDCERGGFLVPLSLCGKLAPKREPAMLTKEIAYFAYLGGHITFQ